MRSSCRRIPGRHTTSATTTATAGATAGYVSGRTHAVDLARPYLDFGVPYRFKDWDLDFIAWLGRTGRAADFLPDDDLERIAGDRLARAYDLIVFPGHEEYVTASEYDNVVRYRDLGGNLAFLSANNFFWSARRTGQRLIKGSQWRQRGRPEAGLARLVGNVWDRRSRP